MPDAILAVLIGLGILLTLRLFLTAAVIRQTLRSRGGIETRLVDPASYGPPPRIQAFFDVQTARLEKEGFAYDAQVLVKNFLGRNVIVGRALIDNSRHVRCFLYGMVTFQPGVVHRPAASVPPYAVLQTRLSNGRTISTAHTEVTSEFPEPADAVVIWTDTFIGRVRAMLEFHDLVVRENADAAPLLPAEFPVTAEDVRKNLERELQAAVEAGYLHRPRPDEICFTNRGAFRMARQVLWPGTWLMRRRRRAFVRDFLTRQGRLDLLDR